MQVPDAIEPAIGYRAWVVDEGRLYSIVHSTVWEPGVAFEAKCQRCDDVPGVDCSCGTYAAATFNRLFDMGYTQSSGLFAARSGEITIAGQVKLWGGIVPGQIGWRAQYAYPHKLLIPYSLWKRVKPAQLAEIYNVPFKLYNLERKH